MSYRRGLRRVYAVLAAGWIVAVVIALPAERLKFWEPDALTIVGSTAFVPPPLSSHEGEAGAFKPPPLSAHEGPAAKEETSPAKSFRDKFYAPSFAQSRTGKTLWLFGLLLGPPAVGYLSLFGIIPWVYRGFRPGTEN